MGDLLRSEEMVLCQVFIPMEAAYFVLLELGELGIVQFKDLNEYLTMFQRNFVQEVLRCYEMEWKLRYIAKEIKKDGINVNTGYNYSGERLSPNEVTDLEMKIMEAEEEIHTLSQNAERLKTYSIQLREFKWVLQNTEEFLKQRDEVFGMDSSFRTRHDFSTVPGMRQLNFVTGVIDKERAAVFERVLWRISKGHAFYRSQDIEEPIIEYSTGHKNYKTVFIVCCHGQALMLKLFKLCDGFRASIYICPSSEKERKKVITLIGQRLAELDLIVNQTDAHRRRFVISVANQWQYWSTMVIKTKAIYHTLNFLIMDATKKCLVGECWVPIKDIPRVKQALADGSSLCSVSPFLYILETDEVPPTFNRTNKYTRGFQNLIDVYGMGTYQEANPALYVIVTFPFLFAVMFGDSGHAVIMILFALYLIYIEDKIMGKAISSEIFKIFFAGRYMILMMGIFSFYTGLVYNDIFSKSVNIFGSSWKVSNKIRVVVNTSDLELHPGKEYSGYPYIFGVDPIWSTAHNSIIFMNSYKMKVSIILGVAHMILGLCVGIINFRYFNELSHIFLEFIPRMLLLCSLFLWMVVMMFMKWIMYSANNTDDQHGTACAPSILICFIDMMLFKTTPPKYPGCKSHLFEYQTLVEKVLIVIAGLSIPVMLFGKPLLIIHRRRKRNLEQIKSIEMEESKKEDVRRTLTIEEILSKYESIPSTEKRVKKVPSIMEEPDEKLTDIFVMQVIDTIEFALGTVSHTASYLRLWALSLAHKELSEVLWERLLCMGFMFKGYVGGIAIFLLFQVWMIFTVLILIVMEGLSAFLHTLRLHWVEFMSKFYMGTGYPFQPFYFKKIISEGEIKIHKTG